MLPRFLPALLFTIVLLAPLASSTFAAHPLDSLTAAEIDRARALLKSAGLATETTLFPYILLHEPPKEEVVAHAPGKPFRREALAVLYDKAKSKTREVVVDLKAGKIGSIREIAGQPSVMLSEFDAAPGIVKADPRFGQAMKRRGIVDLEEVAVDIWAYGTPDTELSHRARLLRAVAYLKGKGKNFYARPIEGFTAIVNMDKGAVEQVIDTEVLPLPPVSSDLDERSLRPARPPAKPLVIAQPKGHEFTIEGGEVHWQNWSFRFRMHPREGIVLQLVRYRDHGKWRSILYRGSLSEMMVPYGHNDPHWTYRAAFDEGEYGIGRYSGSLERGVDVPENARLFDAVFANDFGKPYVTRDAVALYERDAGVLWKHFDMYDKKNYSRRGRQLVLGFITTISNYDYGLNWVFHQDGTLELEAQLTGIMLAKGSRFTTMPSHDQAHDASDAPDMIFAHLVAPNVVAPHHQHFFNFRLDLDIDGAEPNSVAELSTVALPPGPANPALNAFRMTEAPLKTELGAVRDLDFKSQRKWKLYHPESRNSLGYPAGYILVPGENAVPYLHEDSPLRKRGGFINHPVWVTQHRDDELYAAGSYPTQRGSADGLPVWVQQDRSLDGKDLVLWYTFCITHAPRPEEWPVMNTHKAGFRLIPAGFFDRNPALDVPRPKKAKLARSSGGAQALQR